MTLLQYYLARWIRCSDDEAATLQAYTRQVQLARHAVLFHLGAPVDDLILLTSGLVRSFQVRDGVEVNLRLLCAPAAALPYTAWLTGQLSNENIQSLTDVAGYRLHFRDYCRDHPGPLAERLQRLLAERHVLALHRRLCMLQAGNAVQRYRYFLASMEPDIVAHTPAFHIASYLGITPESLSRIRRKLSAESTPT